MIRVVVQIVVAQLFAIVAAATAGCAREVTSMPVAAAPIAAGGEVWAIAGRAVAVPMAAGSVLSSTERVRITRPDGVVGQATIWRVDRSVVGGDTGWLGSVWKWSAKPAGSRTSVGGSESAWAVIPPELTSGLMGRTEGERHGGRWRVGDSTVRIRVIERCEANEASTRFQAAQDEDGALRHALLPALASPFTAWRARMTLGDAQVPGGADVLSTIDANETCLWAAALDRLSLIDDDLSRSVFGRLTSLADFGPGTRLPVWLQSGPALAQLRADLLSDDITADQRSARARAWLDAQPAAAAWVCDDAGLRDARTGEPTCTVAFVNLSDNPVSVSAVVEGSKDAATTTSAPELMVVGPWTAARLHALAPTGAAGGERAVVVRAGGWVRRLPVLCDEILARPPGLPIGPFVLEISSDAVAAGSEQGPSLAPIARPVPREWATAGLLMSEPVRRDAGSPSSQTEREAEWTIYLECAHPKSDSVEGDRVRILFGPTEGSAGVREIVIEPASAGVRDGAPQTSPDVRIVRREDRWVCWIRVPADAIEEDGRMRLGLVRESTPGPNTAAIISSWPRPMLPGSTAGGYGPGRLCIDLTQWSRVGGDR